MMFFAKPLSVTAMHVYATTSVSSDKDIDDFYGELEEVLNDSPKKDIKIIMRDGNANGGIDRKGWQTVMGRFGFRDRKERGEDCLILHYNKTCISVIRNFSNILVENGHGYHKTLIKSMIDLILLPIEYDKTYISRV